MSFRRLLAMAALAVVLLLVPTGALRAADSEPVIMTVRGPIAPSELGRTLAHEHVICDFIGAKETGPHRYDREEVVRVMKPYLEEVRARGFSAIVDATPKWIGRDPLVLRRLSELTGLHVLTNTGYYGAAGDKFLPPHAFEETSSELAARWIREWEQGIGDTGVRPGFIKTGVDHGPLSAIDRKLIEAAARAHLATGLTIACHTGEKEAALGVLEAVKREGVSPRALVIVHADSIDDPEVHLRLARAGTWVEYDAVGSKPIETHVRWVRRAIEAGEEGKLLLSHDAGWYSAGEAGGAKEKIRPFTVLSDRLVPALVESGIERERIEKLLRENPREAFTVRVRRLEGGGAQR